MLRVIRTRFSSTGEMWFVAGGATVVLTLIAGGFGLTGRAALIMGGISALLMVAGWVTGLHAALGPQD